MNESETREFEVAGKIRSKSEVIQCRMPSLSDANIGKQYWIILNDLICW
jgi:hypothetical protein